MIERVKAPRVGGFSIVVCVKMENQEFLEIQTNGDQIDSGVPRPDLWLEAW